MKPFIFALCVGLMSAAFFLWSPHRTVTIGTVRDSELLDTLVGEEVLPELPEAVAPNGALPEVLPAEQHTRTTSSPLTSPPYVVKGIYVTGWTAGSARQVDRLIQLIESTELNAVVIDVKDYSGYVSYRTGIPAVKASGAEGELRIGDIDELLRTLHEHGIYTIARVTVFQDPIFARARPDLALANSSTGGVWLDRKGLAWLDPAGRESWQYVAAIAKNARERGFDEINFDYIRFPTDGDVGSITYPFWDETKEKHEVIAEFFRYLRSELPHVPISADLFGLATVNVGDLGIGQVIEDAYASFDFVSPMIYPSHFASGFLGYANPAEYPYEIISYSLERAAARLASSTMQGEGGAIAVTAKLRPWLQVFDIGAVYDATKVREQIRAVDDALSVYDGAYHAGWLLWDPKNSYAAYQ